MTSIKSSRLLLSFIKDLYKNEKYLNGDMDNNYELTRRACQNLIDRLNISFNVSGVDNIPNENSLIASNHISFFDIIALVSSIDKSIPFAAAKELMNYPILKNYISSIECVLIDRETDNLKVMKEQLKNMEDTIKNKGLILFPEGECSYGEFEGLREFKKGGFISVNKNDIQIVPTYIRYKDIYKIGKWILPIEEIDVTFGEPFRPSQITDKKIKTEELAQYTQKKVLELRNNN